jgi:hypothetical protein
MVFLNPAWLCCYSTNKELKLSNIVRASLLSFKGGTTARHSGGNGLYLERKILGYTRQS